MSSPTITPELLRSFPLFQTVPASELVELTSEARFFSINRRGVIYQIGDSSEFIYFLFEGRLQGVDFTLDGREVGLFFVEPKEYCGELALFDPGPQSETVIATVKSMILAIPLEEFRRFLYKHPAIISDTTARIAKRVRALTNQRTLLAIPDIPQRVCAQLVSLTEADPHRRITNPPTHQELGIMLNTSRETVTRVFQRLQNLNIVKREGTTSLEILDLEQLKAIASGEIRL